jgi:hypothetical protein
MKLATRRRKMETRTYGRVRLPLVLWGLVLAACAPAGPSFDDDDRAAIAGVTSQVLEIANTSKDWAEYARLYYTEDAVSQYPAFANLNFEQIDVGGSGDLAYVYGQYSMDFLGNDGAVIGNDRGKFIEIWTRLDDGSWKIQHDIFNSDLPLPEAGSGS